jgi:hypothetical protein
MSIYRTVRRTQVEGSASSNVPGWPDENSPSGPKCNGKVKEDGVRAEGVHTDVKVHKPTVRGSRTVPRVPMTALLCANKQKRCQWIRLKQCYKRALQSSPTCRRRAAGLGFVAALPHQRTPGCNRSLSSLLRVCSFGTWRPAPSSQGVGPASLPFVLAAASDLRVEITRMMGRRREELELE